MSALPSVDALMHLEAGLKISVAQSSQAGRKPVNEDSIGIRIPDQPMLTHKGLVAVLADGVSSAEAGREASESCVQSFLADYFSTPDSWSVKTSVQRVLTALNRWLYGQSQRYLDHQKGYVSTLCVLVLKSTRAHLFHVGDSRIWLLRGGQFEQLTRDHAAYISEGKAYLTRAMGLDLNLDIDYSCLDVQAGDRFLMTSDGVHDFVCKEQIAQILTEGEDLERACIRLIGKALEQGSDDNLSCQLLRVDELPLTDVEHCHQELVRLPFPPPLTRNDRLDGYQVEQVIHASNRSQVYLVRDCVTGELLVMKTPSPNFEDDPAYIERFVMEEWIASRVSSPLVVRPVRPRRPRSRLYYLTEHVAGVSLSHWMRDNSQPDVRRVVAIVEQIVKAARAFHRREMLHQDLKPDNILIDNQDRIRLVDFGSCRVAGISEIVVPIQRDRVLGTASYSAPEQVLGQPADARAELFSIGVIAYEMLTGKHPYGQAYEKSASPQAFQRLCYVSACLHNPMVPQWIDGALKKALTVDPRGRYSSLSEWVHDLNHPNPNLMPERPLTLVDRNPLLFWQTLSALLLAMNLVLLWRLLG